jgi:hypothetical protein
MVFSETPNMSEQQFDSSGGLGPGPSDMSSQLQPESHQLSFGGRGPPTSDPRHLMPHQHEAPQYMGMRAAVTRHPIERHGGPPSMSGEGLRPVHSRPIGRSHGHRPYGPRHRTEQPRSNHWS